ncbi:hypothetical protein HAX39_24540 [Citrobacter freundii]|nr:hypothetical protein [Citrobacter freundii]
MAHQLHYFLAYYGVGLAPLQAMIDFACGEVACRVEVIGEGEASEVVLFQYIACCESKIVLRLSQCAFFESICGVVGGAFILDNRLYLATVLPDDLTAEEWIAVSEHQKDRLNSFLGK